MFRSDDQLAAVCEILCARAGLGSLWTAAGPTERAVELVESNGGPLSSGERVMLLAAWAFWNGRGDLVLADVAHRLDSGNLAAVGSLLVALAQGEHEIDEWRRKMAAGTSPDPGPSS
jgi:hypothetical protein